ncbi:hypothetical protein KYB31_22450 [Clostridium felsineum]|uniref:hypothetical protein n=1 Tax=Clostridium felsineum TaxID=36839 RepID=UPI00214DD93B|nr:hypothetical protein [Clostridium felsineum]MCR3761737.1 hypothetical protein [Clostridium felsineum]
MKKRLSILFMFLIMIGAIFAVPGHTTKVHAYARILQYVGSSKRIDMGGGTVYYQPGSYQKNYDNPITVTTKYPELDCMEPYNTAYLYVYVDGNYMGNVPMDNDGPNIKLTKFQELGNFNDVRLVLTNLTSGRHNIRVQASPVYGDSVSDTATIIVP